MEPSAERKAALLALQNSQFQEAVQHCTQGIARTHASAEYDECWRLRILHSLTFATQGQFGEGLAILEELNSDEDLRAETRARVLNHKSFVLSRMGRFVDAKAALDGGEKLAATADVPSLRGEIAINRSTLLFYLADYEGVELCATTALEIAETHRLRLLEAGACAAMGKSLMYRTRQTEAIAWFQRALAIYEREGHNLYAGIMRSEIGCCHFALGSNDLAFEYFSRVLEVSRNSGARASLHIDLANMGCAHLRRGEYSAALAHFQEALAIARELGDRISTAKWLENIALAYRWMGNPMLAQNYQLEAERVGQQVAASRAAAR